MEEMAVILYDVSFLVEIQLEDDSVVGFAQIVYREQRPDNVCYSLLHAVIVRRCVISSGLLCMTM